MPPAWALPCSRSFSAPPRPKLNDCRFHVASVKPSPYAQSCIRLCIANRFARAASMSLRCGDLNVVSGLQRCVEPLVRPRVGVLAVGPWASPSRCRAMNESLLVQLWTANALLPRVVKVGLVAARVDVPHRRRRVVEHQRAVRRRQPAPAHARVGARVVLRRRVREHRPGRVVLGQVVDETFADEHLAGLGVDERGEAVVALDQRRLPGQADAVARRRHGDQPRLRRPVEPAGVEHRPAAPLTGVVDRAGGHVRVARRLADRGRGAHVARAGDVRVLARATTTRRRPGRCARRRRSGRRGPPTRRRTSGAAAPRGRWR